MSLKGLFHFSFVVVLLGACATARDVENKGLLTPKLKFTVIAEARAEKPCEHVTVEYDATEIRGDAEKKALRKAVRSAGFKEAEANGDCTVTMEFRTKEPATKITIGFLVGYTHTVIVRAVRNGVVMWSTQVSVMVENEDRKTVVRPLLAVAKDFFGKSSHTSVSRSLQSEGEAQEVDRR